MTDTPKFSDGQEVQYTVHNRIRYGTVKSWHGPDSQGNQMYSVTDEGNKFANTRFLYETEMEPAP